MTTGRATPFVVLLAFLLGAGWVPAVARADEPIALPAPTSSATAPPPPPPSIIQRAADALKPDPALSGPPNEPPRVPSPGPLVLGGRPETNEHAAVPLRWPWAPFSTVDYVIGGSAAAITLATAIVHPLSHHSLQGGFLVDDAVRNYVNSTTPQTRYAFRDASDVGLSLSATWPFFVDALSTAWWYRGNRDVAQEMALRDLQTLAIAGAVQGVTNILVSRQRPYGVYCGTPELPSNALDCTSPQEYRSFFSGHATFSFASAALICLDHTQTSLLGSPWDGLSCGTGYVLAAATTTFRVLADMHYVSDVVTGALVGTLIGYGVPYLHARHIDLGQVTTGGIKMQLVPSLGGAGVLGTF